MSTLLSDRQTEDLHKSILDYLSSAGFGKTAEQFRQEAPNLADFQADPDAKTNGLLVKKWTSVIRQQKKIMDLETRLSQAMEEISNVSSGSAKRTNIDWYPTSNAKHTFHGHREPINAVSFHPVFSSLASASSDATIKIWDWDSGELERTLKGHTKSVTDCDYDSTGKHLVSSSYDLFVKLWNVDDEYKNFATLRGHEHSISSVRFLPGDNRVASSSRDNTVRIWDIASTHCIKVLHPHDSWVRSASPSYDGRLILTCSDDHTARIVDIESGLVKAEMRGHENFVEVAVFVPSVAISAIRDLIALPSNAPSAKDEVMPVAFVVTGSRDRNIKLWDALRGRCLWTFIGHDNWVRAVAFHPSGNYLLSTADDGTIRVWDLKTGRCTRKIDAHGPFVQCLAWGRMMFKGSDDDALARPINVMATGGSDKLVKVWLP